MADYKIVNAEQLDADLTAVANAIRKRSGTTAKMEFPAGFEEAVESIPTGGVELPGLTNPASDTDLAIGKELIDQNGNVVTGTLYELDSIDESIFGTKDFAFGGTPGGTTFNVKGAYNVDIDGVIVRKGAGLGVRNAPTDFFGDATADDVAKGKKFTSAAGLLVEGKHECEGGAELPELTNPASASDMASGKELIDANGNIVAGTLKDGGRLELLGGTLGTFQSMKPNGTTVRGVKAVASADTDRIIRAGDEIGVVTAWDKFGDARPEDVTAGKTFTSAAGLLVTGTASGGTDGGFTVTDDGEGNVTITSSAITDNNGDVVIG